MSTDRRPVALFVMGPTASGKTDLAVQLVERHAFDIISVDSAMVYRGLDIGTAKPDVATLARAPHRLIDIVDPAQAYSVARFRSDALAEIRAVHRAGRTPLLVGGTMLYFRALQCGLSELPDADPEVRACLDAERRRYGSAHLHARLADIDPAAAARIHPNDAQRIQRALEVYRISGRTLTELYASGKAEILPFRVIKLILATADRSRLHRRIEARFYRMLEEGFVAEVEKLRARPDLDLHKPALRAVGYRQVWHYLDGGCDYPTMVQRGIAATRQFAKRQYTWLRGEIDGYWLNDCNRPGNEASEYLQRQKILPK